MHGPAQPLVETILPCEQLCQGAVYDKLNGQLFYIALRLAHALHGLQGLSVKEILHIIQKLFVIQFLDAGQAFGQNLTVASVASEGEIIFVQQVRLTHSGRLLAQGEMGGTRVGGLYVRILCLGLDLVQHILELPADGHVAENTQQILFGKIPLVHFFLHGLLVHVDRNILKCDFSLGAHFVGIDI